MGAIRLLLVLADGEPANRAVAAWAARQLERPAFAPRVAGPETAVRDLSLPPDVPRAAWPEGGWRARRQARRLLAAAAGEADAVVAVGYRALDAVGRIGPVGGIVVYARTVAPRGRRDRQLEAWWATRADARWVAGPRGAMPEPAAPPAREAVRAALGLEPGMLAVALGGRPSEAGRAAVETALAALGREAVVLDLGGWGPSGAPTRYVAASGGAVAAADLLLLADADAGDGTLVDAAMQAAVPVVASPAPAHVGRFRCPVEGFLVPLDRPEVWAEVAAALADDIAFRQAVGEAARRRVRDDDHPARELGSLIAGTLVRRTGRCPVCPEHPDPVDRDGVLEGPKESALKQRETM